MKSLLKPKIIPRSKHCISRQNISKNALKVLYRLKKAHYKSYIVGGGIRDLLLNGHPKDFDIATDAYPQDIKKIFRNCRLIGRRFRLAHIYFGREIIEVSTFRAHHDPTVLECEKSSYQTKDGMLLRDNVYGSIEEDVMRRDFTINAIYYNIYDFSLVDYVGGVKDIKKRQIKIIGDPVVRYREDPVRMLRAIRFAVKLDFKIHKSTGAPIFAMADLITNVAPARLFEEYLKFFLKGYAEAIFYKLVDYGLYQKMFPQVEFFLTKGSVEYKFLQVALANTDRRVLEGKPVAPAFLLAVFLWLPLQAKLKSLDIAYQDAVNEVIFEQKKTISIPKYFVCMIHDIWLLQPKFAKLKPRNITQLYKLPRFRAAYDFLLLRAEAGDPKAVKLADWWYDYVEGNDDNRKSKLAGIK